VQPYEYWKKHAVRLEPLLIQKSDLIVCNSPQLSDYAKTYNEESYDVGQGVDLSAYNTDIKFDIPENVQPIPKPRIGYIGDIISMRLDADLIYELAKSKPDYSFIMIGNEDKVFATHALHSLKNVYFLGRIPKDRVPEYMSSLDVCLNPQLVNEVTIGNYPRKVDEYLAMGKPVIATRTKTMELFKEHVYLCDSLEDYKKAVEKSLHENSPEKENQRILFAKSHSWENNVNMIYECIQKVLSA
jgi:glycosyltransferase involved in cell wall biosynthesis